VDGDVHLDARLLICKKGKTNDVANSVPVNNALGIMASNNITTGSSLLDLLFNSKINLMGAIYAEKQIQSLRQARAADTLERVLTEKERRATQPTAAEAHVIDEHLLALERDPEPDEAAVRLSAIGNLYPMKIGDFRVAEEGLKR
jgi:hypothetical protein